MANKTKNIKSFIKSSWDYINPFDLLNFKFLNGFAGFGQTIRRMTTNPYFVPLVIILVLAGSFRFYRFSWDDYHQFHPDERYLLDPQTSVCYPQEPQGLQYGSLPLYIQGTLREGLIWLQASGVLHNIDMGRVNIIMGRLLSACFDLGTIVMLFFLGARLFNKKIGLFATLLYAFTVLPIQLSHFFAVDTFLTFFVVLCLFSAAGILLWGHASSYIFAGIFFGLSLACKTSALPLALVLLLAHFIHFMKVKSKTARNILWGKLLLLIITAGIIFFIAMPYSLLDIDKFRSNNEEQGRILVSGISDVPYTRQFFHTTPILYYINNMVRYAVGWPLGLLLLAGWIYSIYKSLFKFSSSKVLVLLASWTIFYFGIVGFSFAKFNRYLLPMIPAFCLMGVYFIFEIKKALPKGFLQKIPIPLLVIIGILNFFYAVAFTSIYRQDHPWIEASRWIYKNIPTSLVQPGQKTPHRTVILNEEWGDDLPVPSEGRSITEYDNRKFAVPEYDNNQKIEMILNHLQQCDYIFMADKRAYGTYQRIPERYPVNYCYYKLMFEEQLGYKMVKDFSSYPHIAGLVFNDDYADESFTLYDHPHVYLFQKTENLPREELQKRLQQKIEQTVASLSEKNSNYNEIVRQIKGRGLSQVLAANEKLPQNRNIGASRRASTPILGGVPSVAWYLLVLICTLIAFPICFMTFRFLPDAGYGLSKIAGIFLLAYLNWLLVNLNIFSFSQFGVLGSLIILMAISLLLFWKNQKEIVSFGKQKYRILISEEIIFLLVFAFFSIFKMFTPNIHDPNGQGYNGGGEPMGITFLSGIMRCATFPPFDPWLGGGHLNYYYWGQLIMATLAKILGVAPSIAYNLSLALIFALTYIGCFSIVYNMSFKIWAGLLAGSMVALFGNLYGFLYFMEPLIKALSNFDWSIPFVSLSQVFTTFIDSARQFQYIWDSTRLIPPDVISEFPYFSFIYGDLHAHNIAIPFSILPLGICLSFFKSSENGLEILGKGWTKWFSLLFLSITVGALVGINTWNYPVCLMVSLMTLGLIFYFRPKPGQNFLVPFIITSVSLVFLSLLSMWPFLYYFQPPSSNIWPVKSFTEIKSFLTIFGSPVFIILSFLVLSRKPMADKWLRKARGKNLIKRISNLLTSFVSRPPLIFWLLIGLCLLTFFNLGTFGFLFLLSIYALITLLKKNVSSADSFALVLTFVGLCITAGCEIIHVVDFMGQDDRMNTMFKFYIQVWVLWGIASAYFFARLVAILKPWLFVVWKKILNKLVLAASIVGFLLCTIAYYWFFVDYSWFLLIVFVLLVPLIILIKRNKITAFIWAGVCGFCLLACCLYPVIATYTKFFLCYSLNGRPPLTLDGIAYIEQRKPNEYQALAWLNAKQDRNEIILERVGIDGETYGRWNTRVASFTGLPSFLGWKGQERQMRAWYKPEYSWQDQNILNKRESDADLIYSSLDITQTLQLMKDYSIQLVYVGDLEREHYPRAALDKFAKFMDVIYQNPGVIIYRIRG